MVDKITKKITCQFCIFYHLSDLHVFISPRPFPPGWHGSGGGSTGGRFGAVGRRPSPAPSPIVRPPQSVVPQPSHWQHVALLLTSTSLEQEH